MRFIYLSAGGTEGVDIERPPPCGFQLRRHLVSRVYSLQRQHFGRCAVGKNLTVAHQDQAVTKLRRQIEVMQRRDDNNLL